MEASHSQPRNGAVGRRSTWCCCSLDIVNTLNSSRKSLGSGERSESRRQRAHPHRPIPRHARSKDVRSVQQTERLQQHRTVPSSKRSRATRRRGIVPLDSSAAPPRCDHGPCPASGSAPRGNRCTTTPCVLCLVSNDQPMAGMRRTSLGHVRTRTKCSA